jgi:hypothetical protein
LYFILIPLINHEAKCRRAVVIENGVNRVLRHEKEVASRVSHHVWRADGKMGNRKLEQRQVAGEK